MAHLLIVTPAARGSRKGNRITADRWARIVRSLGHRVEVTQRYHSQPADLLVALHARKSADSIQRFAELHPTRALVVALTGTDLYQDIRTSRSAQRSLDLASRLILLQPHGISSLPPRHRAKAFVIYQSHELLREAPLRLKNVFEVCVSGHLRPVKDSFRAALAARKLPSESTIRITHIGAALSRQMRERAEAEMARNARYHWLGEVSHAKAKRLLARSRLLVVSSKLEGGANVVTEALAARVPILSTRISGSIGLLGDDYPGYFEVGATEQLAALMYRCEKDPVFYRTLVECGRRRAATIAPARERAAWRRLIAELLRP